MLSFRTQTKNKRRISPPTSSILPYKKLLIGNPTVRLVVIVPFLDKVIASHTRIDKQSRRGDTFTVTI